MAFILLLILSLTTFVQVESRVSAGSLEQLRARMNAQLALQIAIGDLQKIAGRDTIATASGRMQVDDTIDGRNHWTGVWDSGAFRADQPNQRPFVAWLVSGMPPADESESQRREAINQLLGPDESVLLARDVAVPTVTFADSRIAWWVGDESQKAKLNLSDDFGGRAQPMALDEKARRSIPSHFNFNALASLETTSGLRDTLRDNAVRIVRKGDVAFISGGLAEALEDGIHDFTTWSEGLLVDTKRGGLRRNLTALFESDSLFNAELANRRVFQPEDYATGNYIQGGARFFGPRWEILRDYYRYRADGVDDEMLRVTNVPYSEGNDPFFGRPDSLHWMGQQLTPGSTLPTEVVSNVMTPVMTRMGLYFRLRTEEMPSGRYRILFDMYPRFTLWNPYNVALDLGSSLKRIQLNALPNVALFRPDNTLITGFTLRSLRAAGRNYTDFLIDLPDTVLQPGELRVFGLDDRIPDLVGGANRTTAAFLQPFHQSDAALVYDITDIFGIDLAAGEQISARWNILSRFTGLTATREFVYFWLTEEVGGQTFAHKTVSDVYLPDITLISHPAISVSGLNSLASIPLEMGGLDIRLRHANEQIGINPTAHFNPRALFGGAIAGDYLGTFAPNWTFELLDAEPTYQDFIGTPEGLLLQDSWGPGFEELGERRVVLFDVPRQPLISLGQLRHANTAPYANQPAFAFGNSFADPHIPRNRIATRRDGLSFADLSWLINDALWDRYFFTGKVPGEAIDFTAGEGLPNRRLIPNDFNVSSAQLDAVDAAAHLRLDGPFNINSLSINAWATFLAGLGGEGMSSIDALAGGTINLPDAFHRFWRLLQPMGLDTDSWRAGFRDLTAADVRSLAEAMVNLIQDRGPFMHLSDFANRPLTDDTTAHSGVVQAAIDASDINADVIAAHGERNAAYPFPDNAATSQAAAATPYLTQGDILAALGPLMTTRGDTFKIRTYGAGLNPFNNQPTVEVYLEAVVQRTVTPVNPSAEDPLVPDASAVNDFGRRYEIVSLRWLKREDLL